MTSALTPEYEEYPQYCYHLSPTITKWCPLEASHIAKLRWHSGFEGILALFRSFHWYRRVYQKTLGQDDTFFHLNHPIRWVRVVGLVVAIDSFYARRVYTVDDSTGVCVECTVGISQPAQADGEKEGKDARQAAEEPAPDPFAEIDVGMVVDVKGNLSLFRDEKQIKIQKMLQVKSTNQEVEFWNKIKAFRTDVLSKPWVLEKKVLRRLEKENRSDIRSREKERQRKKSKAEPGRQESKEHRQHRSHASGSTVPKKPYKPSKLSSVMAAEDGQYDALGL